ncbi:hypothetical protein BW13_00550 [Bifidobacterium sp. UTCIF-37]|nr:hypothetical protein BW13_00550 [Bifidobacterium sp. UTCIF-37]TPF91152.1 hypothetical protein BW11_00550 [Bifidobacterium sp. UTCIF-38]
MTDRHPHYVGLIHQKGCESFGEFGTTHVDESMEIPDAEVGVGRYEEKASVESMTFGPSIKRCKCLVDILPLFQQLKIEDTVPVAWIHSEINVFRIGKYLR